MEVVCDECTVDCSALTTENCQTAKPPDTNFITNNNSKLSLHFYYNDFFSRISLNIYLFNVYITYNVHRNEQSTSWGEAQQGAQSHISMQLYRYSQGALVSLIDTYRMDTL